MANRRPARSPAKRRPRQPPRVPARGRPADVPLLPHRGSRAVNGPITAEQPNSIHAAGLDGTS